MPVVGSGDYQNIDALVFQHFSNVGESCWDSVLKPLDGTLTFRNGAGIYVADARNLTVVLLCKSTR
jgi:hypothetical protein